MKITIITPTYKRDISILRRCIASVKSQILSEDMDINQIVVYDDMYVPEEYEILKKEYPFINLNCTGLENSNTWGASPRQYALDNYDVGDYLIFLDDDNILFPNHVSTMVNSFEEGIEAVISKIIHLGPLSSEYYNFYPNIVTGNPPALKNIDTLNVMFRKEVFEKYKWVALEGEYGYFNDGYTYQEIFKYINFKNIDDILAVHL